jgi:hypothetical protein
MKRFVIGIALIVGSGLALAKGTAPAIKRFNVGMGTGKIVKGATVTSSSSLTVSRQTVHVGNDGSAQIDLVYLTPTGQQLVTRQIMVAPGCGIVTDAFGNVVAATAPAALCTAITSFVGQVDSVIGSAATGNKLNL